MSTIADFYPGYQKDGRIDRKPGSGRKRKTTELENRDILISAKRRQTVTSKELKKDLNLEVSKPTIQNPLHEFNFYSFFAIKKPFISAVNQHKRLEFAKKHKNKPIEFWKSILWSNESPFVLRFQGKKRMWRFPTERYAPYCLKETVKHDRKINVWGYFAAHGVGRLYCLVGMLDQNQFHSILVNQMIPSAIALFPSGEYIFQQDNDPKHTAKKNQFYLLNKNCPFWNGPASPQT